ncbi:unnamed protein product [Mucor hiemalis]
MKIIYSVASIALTLLFTRSIRALSQDDLDAFETFGSVPCPTDMRQFFHNCPEGPDCYDCMEGGQKQCYAAFPKSPRNLDCTDCVFRARFIYCKVNPFNATEKIPADFSIPKAFQNSDAFKVQTINPGAPSNPAPPASNAAPPASNAAPPAPNPASQAANPAPPASNPAPPTSNAAPPASNAAPPASNAAPPASNAAPPASNAAPPASK